MLPDLGHDQLCTACGEYRYEPNHLRAERLVEAVALQMARDEGLGTAHRSHRVGKRRKERASA
jgi:hypothetical protein